MFENVNYKLLKEFSTFNSLLFIEYISYFEITWKNIRVLERQAEKKPILAACLTDLITIFIKTIDWVACLKLS
jgi:hypothetical protein